MARYMLIMRVSPEAEAMMAEQEIDFDQIIESMGRFNEELMKAGVLLAGEGLTGPDEGFVVDFDADPPVVTDGPYTEAKELFNGFWILDVSSKEEAKRWALKVPLGPGVKLEVRRVSETEGFSDGQPVGPQGDPVEGRAGREAGGPGAGGRGSVRSVLRFPAELESHVVRTAKSRRDSPVRRNRATWRGSEWVRATSRRGRAPRPSG